MRAPAPGAPRTDCTTSCATLPRRCCPRRPVAGPGVAGSRGGGHVHIAGRRQGGWPNLARDRLLRYLRDCLRGPRACLRAGPGHPLVARAARSCSPVRRGRVKGSRRPPRPSTWCTGTAASCVAVGGHSRGTARSSTGMSRARLAPRALAAARRGRRQGPQLVAGVLVLVLGTGQERRAAGDLGVTQTASKAPWHHAGSCRPLR